MKKTICLLLFSALIFASAAAFVSADGDVIPPDTPITYGYLEIFKAELKQEIIEELRAEGAGLSGGYKELELSRGDVIVLGADCEVIFRGGGAAALTSSTSAGEGLTDILVGVELFSGESLSFGHIYHSSASDSEKAVLVTGDAAYFTVHGSYEIR